MDPAFWRASWQEGRIGFHMPEANPDLVTHGPLLLAGGPKRVLVPLCGKTVDLDWLARQGHQVTGVELCELAAQAFHAEQRREPTHATEGAYTAWRSDGVRMLVGDVFDLPALGESFDVIWDRAATVALPPAMRARYRDVLHQVGAGGELLLVTFSYDPAVMSGPPFSVGADEVRSSYEQVELLHEEDVIDSVPQFRERGHRSWIKRVWRARLP